MRSTAVILFGLLLLVSACTATTSPAATATPSPSVSAVCPHDWSVQSPMLQLSEPGVNALTVRICTQIWGSGELGGSVVSSDASVLAVVPYPFPAGTWAYFAMRSGTAVLSSGRSTASCPPNAMCVAPETWRVTVTVIP